MEIIKVLPKDKIIVRFNDEHAYEKEIHWNNFKRGTVSNPYDRTVFGIGYLGVGKYETKHDGNNVNKSYSNWNDMFVRCYSEGKRDEFPAYYGICTVCKEWHNYQNFAAWYEENFYPVEGVRVHIDKDILIKGNKLYSPETCCYVPQRINMVFMTCPKTRDIDLPNAVYRCTKGFKTSYNGKSLGTFTTVEEAINAHDTAKSIHIKKLAEEYKYILPTKVYNALLQW